MNRFRSVFLAASFLVSCTVFAQQSATGSAGGQTQTAPPATQAPSTQAPTTQVPAPQTPATQAPGTQPLPDMPDSHAGPEPTGPTVVFDTTMGQMACRLFDKQAPVAVANFVGLAQGTKEWTNPETHAKERRKPFYDGTTFHRVIPQFMIQGGDPLGTGMGDPGYSFNDEFDPALNFDVAGRLAMANSGPNTNGSQFFITEAPADYLDQKYTIFGQCDDASVWVVKAIARVNRDGNDKPLEAVVLKKVTILPAGQAAPAAPRPAAAPQQ